jgi:leader peptidase (prepilin peptidase)/N-methyltransferase
MSGAEAAGAVFAGVFGACLGSFLAVAAERVPKGESLGGRSHCVCGAQIRARDNVPILGYLMRGGRAQCCGARIPWWYVAVEIGTAAVAVGIYLLVV